MHRRGIRGLTLDGTVRPGRPGRGDRTERIPRRGPVGRDSGTARTAARPGRPDGPTGHTARTATRPGWRRGPDGHTARTTARPGWRRGPDGRRMDAKGGARPDRPVPPRWRSSRSARPTSDVFAPRVRPYPTTSPAVNRPPEPVNRARAGPVPPEPVAGAGSPGAAGIHRAGPAVRQGRAPVRIRAPGAGRVLRPLVHRPGTPPSALSPVRPHPRPPVRSPIPPSAAARCRGPPPPALRGTRIHPRHDDGICERGTG